MAGTAWRPSLVRLVLCAGFLCAAWMVLGAGQARAAEVTGSHDSHGSHAARSLTVATGLSRTAAGSVARKAHGSVAPAATKALQIVQGTQLGTQARPVVTLLRTDVSSGVTSVTSLTAGVTRIVGVQRRIQVPKLEPILAPIAPLRDGAASRGQARHALSPSVRSAQRAPAAVVTLATGLARAGAMAGPVVHRPALAASLPQPPRDPLTPWPTPTPMPSPLLERSAETGSGATEFAMPGTRLAARAPESSWYADALALPASSAVIGPDQRPD